LVTLKLTDAAPTAIFESLTAQTGLTFDEYSVRNQLADLGKMSVDYQAQPVWQVLRELTSKLDVSLRPYDYPRFAGENNGVTVRVEPGNDPDLHGPVCESGPFLVIASRVARSASLAPSPSQPSIQRVELELIVLVDPKSAREVNRMDLPLRSSMTKAGRWRSRSRKRPLGRAKLSRTRH